MSLRNQNVFALLVHDEPSIVEDAVSNLRYFDPDSRIIIYDASIGRRLMHESSDLSRFGAEWISESQEMRWGMLHPFALASIRHLGEQNYRTITFVDSDQLLLRPGYSKFLADIDLAGVGVLSTHPHAHGVDTNILSVRDLQAEWLLWRDYLAKLKAPLDTFSRWTFWPGTVLTRVAAQATEAEFRNEELIAILATSRAWATEECLIPMLSYALGFREIDNPSDRNWCRFRTPWRVQDLLAAQACDNAFFMHPVIRKADDPVRKALALQVSHRGWTEF